MFKTSVELNVYQHEPRQCSAHFLSFRILNQKFCHFFIFFFFSSAKHPPTSIRKHGAAYYEWRVCNSAVPKWIGLIVNGLWWFTSAYTLHLLFLLHFRIIVEPCTASTLSICAYPTASNQNIKKKKIIRGGVKVRSAGLD